MLQTDNLQCGKKKKKKIERKAGRKKKTKTARAFC